MLCQFQLGCRNSACVAATSSTASETDQSRINAATSLPNTAFRLAMPTAVLLTRRDHLSPSELELRSTRYRRSDHVAPRVDTESPAAYGDELTVVARKSRYLEAFPPISMR